MQFPDSVLIQGLLRKDEKAFRILYDTFFPKVYNYTFFQIGEKSKAEKATEEVFIELIHSLDRIDGNTSLKQWIFRITRRCLANIRATQMAEEMVEPWKGQAGFSDLFKLEETLLNNATRR